MIQLRSAFTNGRFRRAAAALLGGLVLYASVAGIANECAVSAADAYPTADGMQHTNHDMPASSSEDGGAESGAPSPAHCAMPVSCSLLALAVSATAPVGTPIVAADLPARAYDLPAYTAAAPEPPPPKG